MRNCKHALLMAGAMSVFTPVLAQKKMFTMAEAVSGMSSALAPKNIKIISWQPGTDMLWQVEKKDGTDTWTATDMAANKGPVTVEQVNYPGKSGITPMKWLDKDNACYVSGSNVYMAGFTTGKLVWHPAITLPENAENITVDKSRSIAYTLDNNLYVYDTRNNSRVPVTAEKDKNVVCGKSVHRDEFGIDHGIFFSPTGNFLAYYRMDQTMVKDYPVIKWDTVPATVEMVKYPMAGGTSHQVTLCTFDIATGKTVTMQTGETEKDHYLTGVTWSPDEKSVYIAILNRAQNHLWLNRYNAETGALEKTLFEETDPKYVHPMHGLTFVPGHDEQFIWWSERDGYQHLYLYNTNGKLIRQLTKGSWVVNELVQIAPNGKKAVITTSKESPLEKNAYLLDIDKAKMERIDKGEGMHAVQASDDGKYILDVYNGAGVPKNITVRATQGSFSKELLNAPDPLAEYDRPQVRNVTITAADGVTPLYGKLILPLHFDSTKKYPVVMYLYNGPNVQLIHNVFPESGNLWYEYMAQHGYIIFTMDGRGSSNRGMAFEQATFRHLGDAEMDDQLKGVDYLRSLPYVDGSRLGIHGWSFGGFMTTSMMLRHPGVFKCAVAGGPVMDWKMYEVMYTERYMDTPDENPEGYAAANLLDKAKNLKGKLLLIHGTNDATVVWQHSIGFLKKTVDENVQVDYFVYPGYEHNVRGKDRVHLMQKITDYFDANLK